MTSSSVRRTVCIVALGILGIAACAAPVAAAPYTVAFTAGGTFNTLYAQGFSTSLGATPSQSLATGAPVFLNQFQFFKSGSTDTASNIRLAILDGPNGIFSNLQGITTSSSIVAGLSSNTVASTASLANGAPITFSFSSLPLKYATDYGAVFVNVGAGGVLTPVLVSALTANYAETPVGSGSFHPTSNYGTEAQFMYSTSNFITTNASGQFFNSFSFAGDANFSASLDTVPEPGSLVLALGGGVLLSVLYRGRHQKG